MSFNENDYTLDHLVGNVQIDRNVLATIRGSVRRSDPDGGSSVPYMPSVGGKFLKVTYTKMVSSTVTDATVNITLASSSYAAIITAINAVDPTNLKAIDEDGFLVLQNQNVGKTHRLEINPYATPASDAAPFLGLTVTPFPGSVSYVYEIGSAPGVKGENNPQGTSLLGKSESITSTGLNRALISILDRVEKNLLDLDRLVIVFKDVDLTFVWQAASDKYHAYLNNDALRLPLIDFPLASDNREHALFEKYFRVFSNQTKDVIARSDVVTFSASGDIVGGSQLYSWSELKITDAFYGSVGTTYVPGSLFTTWGTVNGGSIYGVDPNLDKHASVSITSIDRGIVYCSGATFQTAKVAKGDPVYLTAGSLNPFDHTGWFAVDTVYDQEHLALRPMGPSEPLPSAGNTPRNLNPSGGGTLRVALGYYIPAGNVHLVIQSPRVDSNRTGFGCVASTHQNFSATVRIATAIPLREALSQDLVGVDKGGLNGILGALTDHTAGSTYRSHYPWQIAGFQAPQLADGTIIDTSTWPSNLQDTLTTLITYLGRGPLGTGDPEVLPTGTDVIGARAVSIGGAAPSTIGAGTLYSQIVTLLTDLQSHVNASSGAHAASAVSYGGGAVWADGTTNPSTNVESQLDKIISDLTGTLGSSKIKGSAVGSDLVAGTLGAQITSLVTDWLKLSRANAVTGSNTFSAAQVMNGASGDTQAALQTTSTVTTRKLLWESSTNLGTGMKLRLYAGTGFELTVNALWGGTNWSKDASSNAASLFNLTKSNLTLYTRDSAAGGTWTSWSNTLLDFAGDGSGTILDSHNADLTLASNKSVKVQGTGQYKHGTKTLTMRWSAGQAVGNGNTPTANTSLSTYCSLQTTNGMWDIPIPLPAGKRILEIRGYLQDFAGTPHVTVGLYQWVGYNSANIISSNTSVGSGSDQQVTIASINHSMTSNAPYSVVFDNSSSSHAMKVYRVEIDYDEP